MTYLLDVNVLIALIDPLHTQHDAAHAWFSAQGGQSWATCAITENGVLRIVGHPRYPNSPGTPAAVAQIISGFYDHLGHVFWPDGINFLLRLAWIVIVCLRRRKLRTPTCSRSRHRTAHSAQLATFDRRLITDAVTDGRDALHLIQPS